MKLFCLGIIIITFIYGLILDIIDLRSSNNPIHEKVSDIYDRETYMKWKNYKKDGVIFNFIAISLSSSPLSILNFLKNFPNSVSFTLSLPLKFWIYLNLKW